GDEFFDAGAKRHTAREPRRHRIALLAQEPRGVASKIGAVEVFDHAPDTFPIRQRQVALIVEELVEHDAPSREDLGKGGVVKRLALRDRAVEIEEKRAKHRQLTFGSRL